jgi:hypothetical protein
VSSFQEKYDRANTECFEKGVWMFRDGKPIEWDRPIWRFTAYTKMRHPLYLPFLTNFIAIFAYMVPTVILVKLAFGWEFAELVTPEIYWAAAKQSLAFALLFAGFMSWEKHRKNLSRWEDL